MHIERLLDAPIIGPELHPSIGSNIQGPSLIRVPDWVAAPLGRYYLYFADHKGRSIRLAHADDLRGPWTVYPPGSLQLEESHFPSETLQAPVELLEKIESRLAAMKLPHDLIHEITTPHIASPDVLRRLGHAAHRDVLPRAAGAGAAGHAPERANRNGRT